MNVEKKADKTKKILVLACRSIGITCVAFMLSLLMIAPFSFSINSFISSPDRNDFNITDFYMMVADRRPVRQLSDDIVIVNIDSCGRSQIADILETVSLLEPKAVGLDIVFSNSDEEAGRLTSAAAGCDAITIGRMVESTSSGFRLNDEEWFTDSVRVLNENADIGIVNLPAKYAYSNIREFPVYFPMENGDTVLSFVSSVISNADPDKFKELMKRGDKIEPINYPSYEFTVYKPSELPSHAEDMLGKIILIGGINDELDMHATPVKGRMAGIEIHARGIQTVLDENWIDTMPKLLNWGIAFLLCFVVVFISGLLSPRIKGLFMRLLQVFLAYLIMRIGYWMYVDHGTVIDSTYTLLSLTFGLFAADIWIGSVYIFNLIREKYKKHKINKSVK